MPLHRSGNHLKRTVALILALALAGCGTLATPPRPIPPAAGVWTLHFHGDCAGRESESLQVTRLDESEIAFGDFRLLRDDAGDYAGSANFIAPMPADGRDIGYVVSYSLRLDEVSSGFVGTQTVVEGGGHGIGCPVALTPPTRVSS